MAMLGLRTRRRTMAGRRCRVWETCLRPPAGTAARFRPGSCSSVAASGGLVEIASIRLITSPSLAQNPLYAIETYFYPSIISLPFAPFSPRRTDPLGRRGRGARRRAAPRM